MRSLVELGCPRVIEWFITPWGSSIETTMRTNLPLLIREISDTLLTSLISSLRDCNSCIMTLKGSSYWKLLDSSPKEARSSTTFPRAFESIMVDLPNEEISTEKGKKFDHKYKYKTRTLEEHKRIQNKSFQQAEAQNFIQEVRERTNKTSVTSRKAKVPLKGLEKVKLLASLDILNPRPQEGLNKILSSKFKQPKSTSQHIAKNRSQFSNLDKRASNHLPRSGQHFGHCHGGEGDEMTVKVGGDGEDGDSESEVQGRDVQGDDEDEADEKEEAVSGERYCSYIVFRAYGQRRWAFLRAKRQVKFVSR
ncbi:hypothetical protein M9H77_17029 [Catharanthus roseus]|uniref:Uncharacterized protein n=1 Tax=Catharanthus roseus TaxID=4058 RepID=A0ACC0B3G7_CATRO|nr:hypothetical protein M9H77_17029 [Catharanthus roseus]